MFVFLFYSDDLRGGFCWLIHTLALDNLSQARNTVCSGTGPRDCISFFPYLQISYGATDPSLSDRIAFPYFYRTVQSDEEEYISLCKVLKYFGWNWIGILKSDDYSGYRDEQVLMKHLSRGGICVAFTISLRENLHDNVLKRNIIEKSSANVIIICGDVGKINSQASPIIIDKNVKKKTFIFLSKWLNHVDVLQLFVWKLLRGSLMFMQKEISDQFAPSFKAFSKRFYLSEYPEDKLLEYMWLKHFSCLPEEKYKHKLVPNCSGKEKLTDIDSYLNLYHSSSLMYAVELMSVALSHMQKALLKQTFQDSRMYKYQLHRFLKNVSYTHDGSPAVSFNEKRELIYQYEIVNPQFTYDGKSWYWKIVGNYIPWALSQQRLSLIPEKIIWKTPKNMVRNNFFLSVF
ncbi:hypothetical protein XELAEV_18003458mg [Xenopus laevis]|nr:hypothetical protein XELAEV_18003458mg [Xenopus laevis]